MNRRYIGVDLGTRRIGLALADDSTSIVSPVEVLAATGDVAKDATNILAIVREYDANVIIVGHPLNMDDSEGPAAKASTAMAEQLKQLIAQQSGANHPQVVLHDERLTSFSADERLAGRSLTRKKKRARQDAIAAQIILESYLAGRSEDA